MRLRSGRHENVLNPFCPVCAERMRINGYVKSKKGIKTRYRCTYCNFNYTEGSTIAKKKLPKLFARFLF